MPVIQSYNGLLLALNGITARWASARRIGLYQNDWKPQSHQTISAVVPATFSGYPGLVYLNNWTPAVLEGAAAKTTADAVIWSHDGGPLQNYIFGVYVVAEDGSLDWAERIPEAPYAMYGLGGIIRYYPIYIFQSKFPGP